MKNAVTITMCIFDILFPEKVDTLFFDKASYVKMYDKIKPYFSEHDLSLMNERVQKAKEILPRKKSE